MVPIAIQLKKKPGSENPIFLPSDNFFDWLLAKIYYRSADAQVHTLSMCVFYLHVYVATYVCNACSRTYLKQCNFREKSCRLIMQYKFLNLVAYP